MLERRYYYPSAPSGTTPPYEALMDSLGAAAYWPLQDATGEEKLNGLDLSWVNSPGTTTGPGGELTSALDLTASSSQKGTVDDSSLRPTTAVTIVGWVKSAGTDNAGIMQTGAGNGFDGYSLRVGYSEELKFRVTNGTDTLNDASGYTDIVTPDAWVFFACVYDTTDQSLYVDGVEETGSPDTTATFNIGYGATTATSIGNWATVFNDMAIAGFGIFASALTDSNISDLFDAIDLA